MRPSILLTLLFAGSASGQGACDNVECHQGAPCVSGEADFSNHSSYGDGSILEMHHVTHIQNVHCECPHGWTGVTCNRIYNSCDGDHKCYNGGNCIPGILDYYNNEQLFCDCSKALDDEGFPFVGKFCEHVSKEKCGNDDAYCVNGGECNDNYPNNGPPCLCENGFEGPHCEFKVGDTPKCTLDCANDGACQLGLSSEPKEFHDLVHLYNNTSGTKEDLMHCVCPPGFGGKLCDVEKTNDKCGSHHCYNGGTCISRIDGDGVKKYHCDCSSAHTTSSSYAGRFCQYESTSHCNKDGNQNGQLFCTNGGTCRNDDFDGCDCVGDFYGPSCEFKHLPPPPPDTQPPVVDNSTIPPHHTNHPTPAPPIHHEGTHLDNLDVCSIKCENFGKCRKGTKDLGVISHLAPHSSELNQTHDENFEHCVCQEGFVGLHCEHRIELCPHNQHVCLHGSKCVKFGDEQSCDCSASTDHANLSGSSCHHKDSQMCTEGELNPVQPRSFCVNGGTCKRMVSSSQSHPGCNCGDEWEGPHCELHRSIGGTAVGHTTETDFSDAESPALESPANTNTNNNNSNNNSGGGSSGNGATGMLVVGVLALVASVFLSIMTVVRNRSYRRRLEKQQLAMAIAAHAEHRPTLSSELELKPINLAAGEPEVYIGPPIDEDGHELHNVEII